ncbi:hypothetical protein X762_08950 [Mesorhizobium sp. LSHC426A00]|nr:hypothetical protein X762_08950 [Mesorhizobium sp. LSHC426A00]ESX57869.1 hypothetical protein X761_07860 [Mesorhizobium sp. LSHC424B00]ESX75394.1 hypothetical protein X758_04100 [Mesorhizobium sp. LSHC416B00]
MFLHNYQGLPQAFEAGFLSLGCFKALAADGFTFGGLQAGKLTLDIGHLGKVERLAVKHGDAVHVFQFYKAAFRLPLA